MTRWSTPPGSNAERSRAYNRGLVLGHVRSAGPSGRAEIARASGLSTQAVSNIIGELVREGWLFEAGRRTGQRGLPAVTYAINAQAGVAFGIELRPDAVLSALIDLEGAPLHVDRVSLAGTEPSEVLPIVERLFRSAVKSQKTPCDRVLGAGVAMPGPFGETGLAGLSTDLPSWAGVDAEAQFSQALGLPVIIENDANAAAMAERISGGATDLSSFAFVYFGTGLGLGLISNGTLFRGAFGNAGELGHIPVPSPVGAVPLEEVASRIALMEMLKEAGIKAETVADLDDLFRSGNDVVEDWLEIAIPALGYAVQTVENLFDPEAVILGGAMPEGILARITDGIALSAASVAHRHDRRSPRLIAGTTGRMTATLGAAALVINKTLTPSLASTA